MAQTSVSPLSSPGNPTQYPLAIGLGDQSGTQRVLPKKDRRHRIGINDEVYALLRLAAQREGRPMSQVTADAILAYVKVHS